jgi:hypothetical protein
MNRESTAALRPFIDDLDPRGLKPPDFVLVDGSLGCPVGRFVRQSRR